MKQYKIGQFAKYMGVSKDLVKHYQSCDIISPDVDEENGYRYYNIRHGERILASRKYRKLGFSVNDARDIVYQKSYDEMFDMIKKQEDKLQQEIEFLQLKKELLEQFYEECELCKNFHGQFKKIRVKKRYFLPHIIEREFIETKDVVEEITNWMERLEFAYKTFYNMPPYKTNTLVHGLLMEAYYFDKLNLRTIDEMITFEEEEVVRYYSREKYVKGASMNDFTAKYLEQARAEGYNVSPHYILHQHIFDDYEDGVRYVNYIVTFRLND